MNVHLFGAAAGIGKWIVNHLLVPPTDDDGGVVPTDVPPTDDGGGAAPTDDDGGVAPWCSVVLWDTASPGERNLQLNNQRRHPAVRWCKVPEPGQALGSVPFAKGDLVLLAVPERALPELAVQLRGAIKPNTTVLSLTSVQEAPLAILKQELPDATIAGLHLLFGPSIRKLQDKKAVLVDHDPGTASEAISKLKGFLESKGMQLSFVSAKQHDRYMSYIQTTTHFILLVFAKLLTTAELDDIELRKMSTPLFQTLFKLTKRMLRQTPETLASIQASPPQHAQSAHFLKLTQDIHQQLLTSDSHTGLPDPAIFRELSKDFRLIQMNQTRSSVPSSRR